MRRGTAIGAARLLVAGLVLAAVVAQLVRGLDEPPFSVVEFFSFFTIESNLIAAGVLVAAGRQALRGSRTERVDDWRGAATLYMAITGLVYTALLSGDDSPLLPWANAVLHYVAPVWMVVDWVADRPPRPIPFARVARIWMVFPTAFFLYTLIRGAILDWYPYPFLDVAENGYVAVLITGAVLGVGMLGAIWLLTRTTSRRAAPAG